MKIISHSVEETADFAGKWLDSVINSAKNHQPTEGVSGGAVVVGLYGDLGSGKTAFAQAVAKALGVEETVTSPTFVIEKIYTLESRSESPCELFEKKPDNLFTHLIHIDAYRLVKGEELEHLGWHDIVQDSGNLVLIEWPLRVPDIMPPGHIQIKFTFIDETTREIEVL